LRISFDFTEPFYCTAKSRGAADAPEPQF